jgi:ketosteroid isomerase-like protein
MKKAVLFFIVIQLVSGSVKSGEKTDNLESLNDQLRNVINNNMEHLSQFYFKDALLFHETDRPVKGIGNIKAIYKKLFSNNKVKEIQKVYREVLGDFFYEIGYYVLADKKYVYMCKWNKEMTDDGFVWKKEYEAISEKNTDVDALPEIKKTQGKMIQVSAKKDNAKTVAAMYMEDACYYTRGGLYQGHREITEKLYPNLQFLGLETKAAIQPKNDMIYEIGMYTIDVSSGFYTLIWRKEKNEWKIYLDSNE